MQLNLFFPLLILGLGLAGTIIVLLYYLIVQRSEIQRELQINRNKILDFFQSSKITKIEVEKLARAIGVEEFTVCDILLNLAHEKILPGLLLFPNLYYSTQYCLDVIQSFGTTHIPIKALAKELGTTEHNAQKILIELITDQGIQGILDSNEKMIKIQDVNTATKQQTCPFCNAAITTITDNCHECHAKFAKCGVCNLVIGNEESITCPFCNNPSHTTHLLEWLKIKGYCPVCKHPLSEEMLK
ncbi:MAG: PCI domain-containing protein [Candidatus Helarchaeota archaeon]